MLSIIFCCLTFVSYIMGEMFNDTMQYVERQTISKTKEHQFKLRDPINYKIENMLPILGIGISIGISVYRLISGIGRTIFWTTTVCPAETVRN